MTPPKIEPRELNWFGLSVESIAAEYESDAALTEWMADNPKSKGFPPLGAYFWAAWAAELDERELDREAVNEA